MLEISGRQTAAPTMEAGQVVASLEGVTKVFGGTVAVADVSIQLRAGEVLALLGENGAGKSTCVKLLAGVHRPDGGQVSILGKAVTFASPLEAQHAGVAVMHQHPGLFPDLSIAENLFIGQTGLRWKLDHLYMRSEAARLLTLVGLEVDVTAPLGGFGHQSSNWSKLPVRFRSTRAF